MGAVRAAARTTMTRTLDILAPTRYPWQFNGPRHSRHRIHNRVFAPLNKISPRIEGITCFHPWPPQRFDLVHAFNRIPLGRKPYLIGFESHLPRGFGLEKTAYFRAMSRSLASDRCRGIIAISEYARRQCLHQHAAFPWGDAIAAKLQVRYPNLPIPTQADGLQRDDGPLRLLFVGNHFARKGGLVALRLAELAQQKGLKLQLDIISALEVGAAFWTDPLTPDFFAPYETLLHTLPNVTFHGALPNAQVIARVANAHFVLLPTFSDSFGFSALEAMAHHTPVIATAQGALPEFIRDGENGILLPFQTDAFGEWVHIARPDRTSQAYADCYHETVRELADATFRALSNLDVNAPAYTAMRQHARHTAQQQFNSQDANTFWDALYERVV